MDGIPLRSDHPCELAPAAVKHIRTHSVVYITFTRNIFSIKLDVDAGFFYFILLIGCNIWYRPPPSKDENYQKQKIKRNHRRDLRRQKATEIDGAMVGL